MSRSLVLRSVAKFEFDEATDWYEQRRVGLGAKFVAQVQRVLDRISEFPESYPIVHGDIHETLVKRFPYAVYYRAEPTQVVVLAIIHTARNPATGQRRT
jgi:toxin ParE1/3/4